VDDRQIHVRIGELIADEHRLRSRLQHGEISAQEEHARLRTLEASLDQCWDLLRQRRARLSASEDPDLATPRPIGEVEGYQQ
jgi:hypothetical protein